MGVQCEKVKEAMARSLQDANALLKLAGVP